MQVFLVGELCEEYLDKLIRSAVKLFEFQ